MSEERVWQSKPMLICSETTDRIVIMVIDDPDEGRQELKMQEKKEYAYTYGK